MWGFESWAEGLGCGKEPLEGTLYIHTAWTGSIDATLHNKSSIRRDIEALLDSFLMTQDTRTTKLLFWWMDRDPNPEDPLEKEYHLRGNGAIEFRRPDIHQMAVGTPLEGLDEILSMGDNLQVVSKNKRPRQLANMFRTLALYTHGGIWVDTDTLLLRDFRPLLEWSGEFATQLAWSNLYNNNFMGLRAKSPIGWDMLVTIAVTGLPPISNKESDMKEYCKYVTQDGGICYGVWYWNHGSIQKEVYQNRGLVPFPTIYSDPGYQGCYAPYLMGWHGGLSMTWGSDVHGILELMRGTFIIHTRAYNAKKPMDLKSNFWQLYLHFREGANRNIEASVPATPIGKRTPAEQVNFDQIWKARMAVSSDVNKYNMIEPPWYPTGVRTRVSFQSSALNTCLAGQKKGWNDLGRNPPVDAVGNCPDQQEGDGKYARSAWAWNPGTDGTGGHLRPWSPRGAARPLCLDANAESAFGKRSPFGMHVVLVGCNPIRRSQRWVFEQGRLVNMESKLCLRATRAPKGDRRITHKDRTPEEKDVVIEMAPCVLEGDLEQVWHMSTLPAHVENKRYGICESSETC
jgi:hypothetical protein